MIRVSHSYLSDALYYLNNEIAIQDLTGMNNSTWFMCSKNRSGNNSWQIILTDETLIIETFPKSHETFLTLKFGVAA